MQSTSNPTPSEENIRYRAYLLWEADGRQDGRDDHYWSEALAQLQGESCAPLEHAPAKASKVARPKKVLQEDNGVAAKSAKKTKATSAGKASAAAETGNEANPKQSKKASTKAGGKVAEKSAVVAKPKLARKTKTVEVSAAAPKSTPDTAPARTKKPRKAVADESQSASR